MLATQDAASGQGLFKNLDFEHPNVPLVPDAEFQVPISDAIPGWAGYVGGSLVDRVAYNTVSLGAAEISLQGQGSLFQPLQGNYSVGLQSVFGGGPTTAAITQTGLVPLGSRSLLFVTGPADKLEAAFAGQVIPTIQLGAGLNYILLGGDITRFAGETGELRFTSPPSGGGLLDEIQFSTQAVPEPGAAWLSAVGISFVAWMPLFRRRSRIRSMSRRICCCFTTRAR